MVFKSRGSMLKEKMLKICSQRIEKVDHIHLGYVFTCKRVTYVTFLSFP